MMNWNNISVWQYQQLMPIITKPKKEWDSIDIDCKILGILHGMTDNEIDSLSVERFQELKKDLAFLNEPISGKPVKNIIIGDRRYKFIYDIRKLNAARYIESKVYSEDLVNNLHKLAASMVKIEKKTLFGWKEIEYDAVNHPEYAEDMLSAKFVDIYHSIVFFYQVYRNWIEISQGYLINEMMKKGMGVKQALEVVATLCDTLDGSIAPKLLPNMKVLLPKKPTI
jgi:hypothetical protein